MLNSKKTYPLSYKGLQTAINDRNHHLKVRNRVLILIGAITLTSILGMPSASVIAFKVI